MQHTELWLSVVGYEDYYEVSNLGAVRSKRRGTLMSPWPNQKSRYLYVDFKVKGARTVVTVHGLVAEAFLGPRPPKHQVCHNNSDPQDNRVENLRYDTPSGNSLDRWSVGRVPCGEQHVGHKLTVAEVREIRRDYGPRMAKPLALKYGVSERRIRGIAWREGWKWLED